MTKTGWKPDGSRAATLKPGTVIGMRDGVETIEITHEGSTFNVIDLDNEPHHFEPGKTYQNVPRYVAHKIISANLGKKV